MPIDLKLKTTETLITAANSVANSTLVRVYNGTAGDVVLTANAAPATPYATVTIQSKTSVFIRKSPTDTVQGTGLLAVGVASEH